MNIFADTKTLAPQSSTQTAVDFERHHTIQQQDSVHFIHGPMDHTMTDETPGGRQSIYRNRSFIGMLSTQFLGAFNDNVFKQILLLICIDLAAGKREENLQGVAATIFAIPFILLSGYCGYLSDKKSKRDIVVISKVLEIVVMALGVMAFMSGSIAVMMVVLFFMGAQSALFGPSKYGILPELFESRDLPRVNGMILMTTFLSIILAFWISGEVKEALGNEVWKVSLLCIGIAVVGTLTSLLIRRTPIAHPEMSFHISALAVRHDTWKVIRKDPRLFWTLVAASIFWITGGVVFPNATNDLGREQFGWGDAATGRLAACTGIGIALGCVVAGYLSRSKFDARLARFGSTGMFVGLVILAIPGSTQETIAIGWQGAAMALIWLGFCAGLFTVPLQVLLQAATPRDHIGRVIGAMNLANWIGLALSGVYYSIWNQIFARMDVYIPYNVMYGAAALLILPLVLFYRPESVELNDIKLSHQTSDDAEKKSSL